MAFGLKRKSHDDAALLAAFDKALAVIEFDAKGRILSANANFCRIFGYAAQEIVGRNHAMFVDPGADDRDLWTKLGRGESDARDYKRIAKGGAEVWIQASYIPVLDSKGAVRRVVKVAADVTAEKMRNAEFEAKLKAISLAQAVIEFAPSGEVLVANENFLAALGYAPDEIKGRHHRMFVEPAFANSPEYQAFWTKLQNGEHVAGLFRRVAKGGRAVLLQASYNPVFDLKGRVVKVVKYATDLSDLIELGAALSRLAHSDVERGIGGRFTPMFASIQADFNSAQETLRTTLLAIAASADAVTNGAKEIASAAENLSGRTEQQAASLEQTAAALSTVTDSVRTTAAGSKEASRLIVAVRANAVEGGGVAGEAIAAMDRIEKSSSEIGQIIGVIDEIAFQTNLLALNAGVEAARAGEAGRGFAVVAAEVRGLAQRSADAAKQIKALISASTQQVADGVRLVGKTGKALGQINEQIEAVDGQIAHISQGAQEQANSLSEVSVAANQMDQGTQQNAAMAEQASAAGESMLAEANKLISLIGQFRTGETERVVRAPPQAQANQAAPAPKKKDSERGPRKAAAASVARAASSAWTEF